VSPGPWRRRARRSWSVRAEHESTQPDWEIGPETLVKPWSPACRLAPAFSRRAAQADRRRWYEPKAPVVLHAPPRQTFSVASIIKELRPLCRAARLYPGLSTGHGGRQLEPRLYLKRAAPSPSPTWQISGRWLMEMPSVMLRRAQPMLARAGADGAV